MDNWTDFGIDLIESNDLDPIYAIAAAANLPYEQLLRWCLAYWCYYHAGVASYVSEFAPSQFYEQLWIGVWDKPLWPRGFERRHFRRQKAHDAISYMEAFGSPEEVVEYMIWPEDFAGISERVQEFVQFGPWIAWKIGDMAERVIGYDVDFTNTSLHIYRDPRQAAALVRFGDKKHPITPQELQEVCDEFEEAFVEYKAPPFYDRGVYIQEVETILCKWKAHLNGFYPLGNDTKHILTALDGWGDLAQELKHHLIAHCSYAQGDGNV